MRVSEAQSFGPSGRGTAATDGAGVSAEPVQAPMGLALRRLGVILGAAVASARELFGHEFAKAYEAQLERLKSQGRSRRSRS